MMHTGSFPCVGSDGFTRIVHINSEGKDMPGHVVYATDQAEVSQGAELSADAAEEVAIIAAIAAAGAKEMSLRASRSADSSKAAAPSDEIKMASLEATRTSKIPRTGSTPSRASS